MDFFGKRKKDDVDKGVQPNYYSETGDDTMYLHAPRKRHDQDHGSDFRIYEREDTKILHKEDWWTLVDEGNKCERGCGAMNTLMEAAESLW